MTDADLVVLGVSSPGVVWAADMLGPLLDQNVPVLLLTKGLAADGRDLDILPEIFRSALPANVGGSVRVMALGGPSIARELAARRHTSVVLTGSDRQALEKTARLLRTPYYHVWTSTDIVGVEACVALKKSVQPGSGNGYRPGRTPGRGYVQPGRRRLCPGSARNGLPGRVFGG